MRRRRLRDRVVALDAAPQSSPGAPLPLVLADEHATHVLYLVHDPDPEWDRTTVQVVGPNHDGIVAVATFTGAHASYFGAPNDEAFDGHPLAKKGLRPYGAFVVEASSWVRELEHRNSVHPYHDASKFDGLNHYALTFHDTTFECVARDVTFEVARGSLIAIAVTVAGRLAI